MRLLTLIVIAVYSLTRSQGFQLGVRKTESARGCMRRSPFQFTRLCLVAGDGGDNKGKRNEDSDFSDFSQNESSGSGSEYTGSVDWDAEWKKVVAKQDQPTERPGKGYYKSEAEVAAIRAANQATEQAAKATANIPVPSVPTWNVIKNDWKFWIGVLAFVSVGASLLSGATAPQPLPELGSSDSYYI